MTRHLENSATAGERWSRRLFEHLPVCILVADLAETPARILLILTYHLSAE